MLNERKIKILEAIINDYIKFGEPVSSRSLEKRHNFGISSATIRNEMSDLEDFGFIYQPHTSSGRVPTDLGYRLHVDNLTLRDLTSEESEYLKTIIETNINHMEYLMKETAKAISLLTNYATIISEVSHQKLSVKYIQLIPMDSSNIVIVIITVSRIVKNSVLNVPNAPDLETLNKLTLFLNELLCGKTVEDIVIINIQDNPHKNLIGKIIEVIVRILTLEERTQIFTSGVNNILNYPEFSDLEKTKGIFKTFEEKDVLITLLDKKDNNDNIQVVIGSENSLVEMKNCSVIKATYKQDDSPIGSIGIIGPTRMDYSAAHSILSAVVKNINSVLYGNKKNHAKFLNEVDRIEEETRQNGKRNKRRI
ncbi:MAG: heat-inducible transcriptional repressor HrcA [Defluviitaleaceae bacterium]|nr:heat-inducible transcriptional repressor HrcA [Defluviitaleaceae bacterium]